MIHHSNSRYKPLYIHQLSLTLAINWPRWTPINHPRPQRRRRRHRRHPPSRKTWDVSADSLGTSVGLQHEKTWWLEVGLNEENYTWIQQKCEFSPAKIVNSVWLGQKTMAIKPAKMGTAPGKKKYLVRKTCALEPEKMMIYMNQKKGAKTCIHWVLLAQPKKKQLEWSFVANNIIALAKQEQHRMRGPAYCFLLTQTTQHDSTMPSDYCRPVLQFIWDSMFDPYPISILWIVISTAISGT